MLIFDMHTVLKLCTVSRYHHHGQHYHCHNVTGDSFPQNWSR